MSTVVKDLGAVSAYAYAVEKGYTGTEAEFAELMADYAEIGQRAEDAAESALNSKTAAQTAATTATNKASEAATSAQTATTKAGEATTAAGTATTAKNDAVAAKTAAETAQGKAEDAQAAAESVAESIPSDYSQLSEDVSDLKEDLTTLKSDGVAPSAEQLLSKNTAADAVPYLFRRTGGDGADREYVDAVVGGTVVWNQLCNSASVTVPSGHKYLSKIGTAWAVSASTGTAISDLASGSDMIIDLTAMFGTAIADYIYSLEQATAGAGVAFFKSLFPNDYYEYNAGELKSVEGVSAHVMRDADSNIIGNYPLDNSLTLRGIPKMSDGKMYFDGDRYLPDGKVERRYGIVDLGTLNWTHMTDYSRFQATISDIVSNVSVRTVSMICSKYVAITDGRVIANVGDKCIYGAGNNKYIYVHDSDYADATAFKTAMSGVILVYELATPTTEEATPYQHLQQCDPNGTEEFVSTGIIPVGHDTRYPENLRAKIEGLPWDFSSLIAPTEKNTTASRNYTTGSLLIMGNVLYKVTANIANGGTITPNTNVTATTLSEILSALAQ